MKHILIDTSIFIEYLRTHSGQLLDLFDLAEAQSVTLATSAVVIGELWSGKSMNNPKVVKEVEYLLEAVVIVPVDKEISISAGELRQGTSLGLTDALIAATALENNYQLATLNLKHFQVVPQLKLWSKK